MDILAILEDHLAFIERFYNAAAEPFETTKRKINAHEEPFVPSGEPEDYDATEYVDRWVEADHCLNVLGHCVLGLLEKALHDYCREFFIRETGITEDSILSKMMKAYDGSHWFEKFCAFLAKQTRFDWGQCPVTYQQIEEINLSRNEFVHDPMIAGVWPVRRAAYFKRYQVPSFADKEYLETLTGRSGEVPEIPVRLKVTRENLTEHIRYAKEFCVFVEGQKTK